MMLIALGVLLALVRFRLYDADAAISRSTTIAALTLALVGVFAGTETVIQSVSQNLFGDMAGAVSSGVAAGDRGRPGRAGPRPGGQLGRAPIPARARQPARGTARCFWPTSGKRPISRRSATRCWRGSNAACAPSRAALLVDGEAVATRHVEVQEIAEERLFPLRIPLESEGAGTIGWLLLGPRPDGSPLGKDERETVEEFAGQIARAVRAVQREMARDADLQDLTRRLRALEAARSGDAHVERNSRRICPRVDQTCRISPPSTLMLWPVMYPAPSEARKAMAAAISSTRP